MRSKTWQRATLPLFVWINCLDNLLSIGRDGQFHTSIYDERDDFNFHITNSGFLNSNILASPAYGVFISSLIRYARASSSYECFNLNGTFQLLSSLTGIRQGTIEIVMEEVLSSIRGSSPLTNVIWHSVAWPYTMTTLHRSEFMPIHNLLPNSTFYRIIRGLHRTFSTDVACQLLRTCICSTCWDQSFPRTYRYFSGLCTSNIPWYFLEFASLVPCFNLTLTPYWPCAFCQVLFIQL